jgi:fumarylacetoacetase
VLNDTHDPALRSWAPGAHAPGTDFPIQNLPLGVFRRRGSSEPWRGGIAIGEAILDLQRVARAGLLDGAAGDVARLTAGPTLNALMAAGPEAWQALRRGASKLLRGKAPAHSAALDCLVLQTQAEMALPATIGDYTDFFTSEAHMLNAGRIFQPGAPPLPNFKWLPIAYHGRASTVGVSPAQVRRPSGQARPPGQAAPHYGPTERLDYELELGAFIGPGNPDGTPIAVADAHRHLFGLCLLNDWSARDIQAWEAMPLGPFLAKNFATTVSPWIVTMEALAPFRLSVPRREDDPQPLPHLLAPDASHFDITLEAWLQRSQCVPQRLSRTNYRHAYWSLAQMVAHHTSNGCILRPGDLLGTGTQSGPGEGEQGCLLELTRHATQPLALDGGDAIGYLQDGDSVILRAACEAPGRARIGFGACRGTVMPAVAP